MMMINSLPSTSIKLVASQPGCPFSSSSFFFLLQNHSGTWSRSLLTNNLPTIPSFDRSKKEIRYSTRRATRISIWS